MSDPASGDTAAPSPAPADDGGVFEIRDFSVASPWEAFICAIEEVVRGWLGGAPASEHALQHEGGHAYVLLVCGDARAAGPTVEGRASLPRCMRELLDPTSDFQTSVAFSEDAAERLKRWFGLAAFVCLVPASGQLLENDEMTLMQGALNVALGNCGCDVPSFVAHDLEQAAFYGRAAADSGPADDGETHATAVRFDVKRFDAHSVPPSCRSLDGLVGLFRSKLPLDGGPMPDAAVTVCRRHTYVLSDWPGWRRVYVGPAPLQLEVGYGSDPIPTLALGAHWPDAPAAPPVAAPAAAPTAAAPPQRAGGFSFLGSATAGFSAGLSAGRAGVSAGLSSGLSAGLSAGLSSGLESLQTLQSNLSAPSPSASEVRVAEAPMLYVRALGRSGRGFGSALAAWGGGWEGKASPSLTTAVRTLLEGWDAATDALAHAGGAGAAEGAADERSLLAAQLSGAAGGPQPDAMAALLASVLQCDGGGTNGAFRRGPAGRPAEGSAAGGPSFESVGAEPLGLLHRLGLAALRTAAGGGGASRGRKRGTACVCTLLGLWRALLDALQRRWEAAEPLPYSSCGPPVPRSSALQQQVQLLSYCIGRKLNAPPPSPPPSPPSSSDGEGDGGGEGDGEVGGEGSAVLSPNVTVRGSSGGEADPASAGEGGSGSDEDEFEDCREPGTPGSPGIGSTAADEDEDEDEAAANEVGLALVEAEVEVVEGGVQAAAAAAADADAAHPAADADATERVGAARALELYGLESGLQLWEPHTQDAGPVTDESMEEKTEELMAIHERLGDSEHARHVRARHQSAQLKSDVQAFKAANPGCVLEDFVRWHSPRDWLPEPGAKGGGVLSPRMHEPNNLWVLLWGATLPVAASQQRPLFDADREAQEVLHRLEGLTPSRLLPQLIHLTVEAALAALAASPLLSGSAAAGTLAELGEALRRLESRGSPPAEWEDRLLDQLALVEAEMEKAASLSRKLPAAPSLALALLSDPTLAGEVLVPSEARPLLEKHVADSDAPDVSEYVIRAAARRPCAPASLQTAQRMYVAQRDDTWRLAIALSVDHDGGEEE